MNLRQLRYFVKVAETGNMTHAAAELFIAQPALGMQIRQLEEDLGVALLLRHSRGVEPTNAGKLLHERALAIFRLVDETRRDVAAVDPHASETVRLGMTPSTMLQVGADIALNVRERLPQVFLSLIEEMSHVLVDLLVRDELDVALAYDVPDLSSLSRTPLLHEDLVLVTLPGPNKGRPVRLVDVLEEPLVLPEQRDRVREAIARAAADAGLEMKVAYQMRSIAAIKSLILRGAAAGVLPYASVLDEVNEGRLDARLIVDPPLRRTLYLAWARGRRTPLRNEIGLTGIIRNSLGALAEQVRPLIHPAGPPKF